jgi:hypothetical protein
MSTIVFITEVVLNFNTGYYNDGEIVTDRKLIFKNYLRKRFWIDIINTFSIIFENWLPSVLLYMISIFRIYKLS